MRVKVLQAMAHGKPLVATSLAAEGLSLRGPTPPLRIADSSSAFAAALVELLRSPAERAALGQRGRHHVIREHDWEVYVGRLEEAYARLVARV